MNRELKLYLILFAIIILFWGGCNIAYYSTSEIVTIEISEKERVVGSDGNSAKYLIFTENETFQNTDLWLIGKFNSSDIEGKLKAGKKYRVKVYGWRIPFLSMYRNIGVFYGEVK